MLKASEVAHLANVLYYGQPKPKPAPEEEGGELAAPPEDVPVPVLTLKELFEKRMRKK